MAAEAADLTVQDLQHQIHYSQVAHESAGPSRSWGQGGGIRGDEWDAGERGVRPGHRLEHQQHEGGGVLFQGRELHPYDHSPHLRPGNPHSDLPSPGRLKFCLLKDRQLS